MQKSFHKSNEKRPTDNEEVSLKEKIEDISRDLEERLASALGEKIKAWRDEKLSEIRRRTEPSQGNGVGPRSHRSASSKPARKIFTARPSLLTELLHISHIQSIYNAFVAILFILFLQQLMEELIRTGSVDLKLDNLLWAFGEFNATFSAILFMNLSAIFVVYGGFYLWSHHRHRSPYVFDIMGGIVYFIYLGLFVKLPLQVLVRNNLPPGSSIALLCEQVRLLMKTWAFVRSNLARAARYKKDDAKNSSQPCPKLSQHLYFCFAPTLVYRDQYPRTPSCDWKNATLNLVQVFGCIIYIHFLLSRFCTMFATFGKERFSTAQILSASFASCFPAFIILLCGFFLLLHSWMNAFAEMLRFADRDFYKDWWNSTSFPGFYRTWNCIVHDWLYEYVYIELTNIVDYFGKSPLPIKHLPMFSVFLISSVVHEYILSFAFKFFYPVLFFMFGGIGCLLMFVRTKANVFNMFIWWSLIFGMGILMCLYNVEWFARINCPRVFDGIEDYLVPRSWFCFSSQQ